jgi:hypothetical protein
MNEIRLDQAGYLLPKATDKVFSELGFERVKTRLDPAECLCWDKMVDISSDFSLEDIERCCRVSKLWEEIFDDDLFWGPLVPGIKDFMEQHKNLAGQSVRDYIKNHSVKSLTDIRERFQEFCSQVPVKGSFDCFFPFNPGCHFNAKVQFGYSNWLGRTPELKKQWIYMRELPSDARGNRISCQPSTGVLLNPSVFAMIRDKTHVFPSFDFEFDSILPMAVNRSDFNVKMEGIALSERSKKRVNKPVVFCWVGGVLTAWAAIVIPVIGEIADRTIAPLLTAYGYLGNQTGT